MGCIVPLHDEITVGSRSKRLIINIPVDPQVIPKWGDHTIVRGAGAWDGSVRIICAPWSRAHRQKPVGAHPKLGIISSVIGKGKSNGEGAARGFVARHLRGSSCRTNIHKSLVDDRSPKRITLVSSLRRSRNRVNIGAASIGITIGGQYDNRFSICGAGRPSTSRGNGSPECGKRGRPSIGFIGGVS